MADSSVRDAPLLELSGLSVLFGLDPALLFICSRPNIRYEAPRDFHGALISTSMLCSTALPDFQTLYDYTPILVLGFPDSTAF